MANKTYYYLKLFEKFFDYIVVKKIMTDAAGAEYTLLYLRLILSTMNTNNLLHYENVCPTIAEEISLNYNMPLAHVRGGLNILNQYGLVSCSENALIVYEPDIPDIVSVGSYSASAIRMKRKREKDKQLFLTTSQCDAPVTKGDVMIDKEIELDIDLDDDTNIIIQKYNKLFGKKQKSTKGIVSGVLKCRKRYKTETIISVVNDVHKRYLTNEFLSFYPALSWILNTGWDECFQKMQHPQNPFNQFEQRNDYSITEIENKLLCN